MYRGAANKEKLGIQLRRKLARPRKERISSLMVGIGMFFMNCFLHTVIAFFFGDRRTPRYKTSESDNCTLEGDTQ